MPAIALTYDYYPFGMLVPNRNYSSPSYRYGFQGQEKDDEIKGNGNSINYKFRMHDPRVGRFFAVDPLSDKYSWNSSYAFSENRVIDSRELEGLERYYSTLGTSLGQVGFSNEIRVVNSEYLYKNVLLSLDGFFSSVKFGSNTWSKLLTNSKVLSENDDLIIAGVGRTIFYKEINSNCTLGRIEIAEGNGDIGMTMSIDGKRDWTIYKNVKENGSKLIDDYYTFVNLSIHEEEHGRGHNKGEIFEHFMAEITSIKHSSFKNMPNYGRKYAAAVLEGYADTQKGELVKILNGSLDNALTYGFKYYYSIYEYTVKEHNKISNNKIKLKSVQDLKDIILEKDKKKETKIKP